MPKYCLPRCADVVTGLRPGHDAAFAARLDLNKYLDALGLAAGRGYVRELRVPLVLVQRHNHCGRRTLARLGGAAPGRQGHYEITKWDGKTKPRRQDAYDGLYRDAIHGTRYLLRNVRFSEVFDIGLARPHRYVNQSVPLDLSVVVTDEVPDDYFCLGYEFLVTHFKKFVLSYPSWWGDWLGCGEVKTKAFCDSPLALPAPALVRT